MWAYLRTVEKRWHERVQVIHTTGGGFTAKQLQYDAGKQLPVEATLFWTLYVLRAIAFRRLMAESVSLLPHISTEKHSHLVEATNVKATYSVLHRLSITEGNMFVHIRFFHRYTVSLKL